MVSGVTSNMADGVALAEEVWKSGKANDLLDVWITLSQVLRDWKVHVWVSDNSYAAINGSSSALQSFGINQ